MDLFFLESRIPLTKTFSPQGKSPYPMVSNFTSHKEKITSLIDFHAALTVHSEAGHCLLKGPLRRPLTSESRAGATASDDMTQWVCLDFDKHEAADIDDELTTLGLGDISYVLQYSASHLLDGTEGTISAHVFMLLNHALPAPTLKNWLTSLNLKHFVTASR